MSLVSVPAPTDEQLLACWCQGMDTYEIGRRFQYPEYCVYSRLWRIREAKRQEHESS